MSRDVTMLSRAVGPPWVDGNLNSHLAMARIMPEFVFRWFGARDWDPPEPNFVNSAAAERGWGPARRVAFLRWAKAERPDLFHGIFHARPGTARLLKRTVGDAPTVQTVQSAARDLGYMQRSLFGTSLVAVSERIRRQLAQVTDRPVTVIRPVVDASAIEFQEHPEPYVLHASNYLPGLGTPEAIEVFARLVPHVGDIRLIVANRSRGSRREAHVEAAARRRASSLGIEEKVSWMGTVPDFEVLLGRASLLLFPATDLSDQKLDIPLVVLEAMARGIPVATFDIEPLDEIEVSSAGVTAPAGRFDALAASAAEVLADDDRRLKAALVGREIVERRFSPQLASRQLNGVYAAALR